MKEIFLLWTENKYREFDKSKGLFLYPLYFPFSLSFFLISIIVSVSIKFPEAIRHPSRPSNCPTFFPSTPASGLFHPGWQRTPHAALLSGLSPPQEDPSAIRAFFGYINSLPNFVLQSAVISSACLITKDKNL